MSDQHSPPRWQAGDPEHLIWAEFGDDYVVYHRPSGKTHFLNGATAALLKRVLTLPKDAMEAAKELAADEGAVGDEGFVVAVEGSLRHLEHLGLVERRDA